MSKKHRFEEDTKRETLISPSEGSDDPKAADADIDDIEIVIDFSEVEEEADRGASDRHRDTD